MRETKCRAWDTDKKKMIYPTERQSITSCCSCIEVLTCHEIAGGRYKTDITYSCNGYLLQYTGLKDKNGLTDIYEDDIIGADGLLKGNKYENTELFQDKSNLLIEGFGTKSWWATYQEAMARGCKYTE